MLDVARRERLRRLIQSEAATADRLCAAVTTSELRQRASAVSINITAVEVFFLNANRLPAHDEERWLDAAEHWLAVHMTVLRGLAIEAASSAVTGTAYTPNTSRTLRPRVSS
jgi:hypothetical protein